MPQIALAAVSAVGKVLLKMLMSLLTEAFIKDAVILGLEKLVKKTASDIDDKLLTDAKDAWKNV